MKTAHQYHSIEADGPWTSEPFSPAERRHIVQGVIGGFIMGRPRWATDLEGNFIYGLDAKGKEMKTAPARHHATKKSRHSTKKSPAQLDSDIHKALILSLKPGAKIIANGYPGSVVRVTPYGMVEVRLPGGVAALSPEDVQVETSTRKSSPPAKRAARAKRAHSAKKGGNDGPRVLKISVGKTFAGQRSITADVQYPGTQPTRVEFVGPSAGIGGSGPVVMITRPSGQQTFVTDPSRFGDFGQDWVRRFFGG